MSRRVIFFQSLWCLSHVFQSTVFTDVVSFSITAVTYFPPPHSTISFSPQCPIARLFRWMFSMSPCILRSRCWIINTGSWYGRDAMKNYLKFSCSLKDVSCRWSGMAIIIAWECYTYYKLITALWRQLLNGYSELACEAAAMASSVKGFKVCMNTS